MSQNKDYSQYILPVGILTVAVVGLDKLAKMIGLAPDEVDKENEKLFANYSPFDPKLWQLVKGSKLLITEAKVIEMCKALKNAKSTLNPLNLSPLYTASQIFTGNFNLFVDFETVAGIIQQCKTKTQVSYLSDWFYQLYKESLIDFLRSIIFFDKDLNRLYQMVNTLPLAIPKTIAK